MTLKLFQVDAFASTVFKGNPAAVCPLETWLADSVLQSIAEETNLSDTAFFVPAGEGFELRWFTPVTEVDLCGHATLATAHVLFEHLAYAGQSISFETRSGPLSVRKSGALLEMNFPASEPQPCAIPAALLQGLGIEPLQVLSADDYVVVLANEESVKNVVPDSARLAELGLRGVIVTAPSDDVDFVSRFFAPKLGINEDPVTGSAHCQLAPYWSKRLGKTRLQARQVSKRGGSITCEARGDRVLLAGTAVTFMQAEIVLEL